METIAKPSSRVVVASSNKGKLEEFEHILPSLGWSITPQGDLGIEPAEETGSTFVENALQKARHASSISGLPAIADDSGLVVPSLGGEPGLRSSRYSSGSDQDNNLLLLNNMISLSGSDRSAFFFAVIVWLQHSQDPTPIIAEARWPGYVGHRMSGRGGFGYDPLFYPQGSNETAAQMSREEKVKKGHRGKAMRVLMQKLEFYKL